MKKWCHNCQDMKMVVNNGFATTNYGRRVYFDCETCRERIWSRLVKYQLNPENFIKREV